MSNPIVSCVRGGISIIILNALLMNSASFANDVDKADRQVMKTRESYEETNRDVRDEIVKQIDARERAERNRQKPNLKLVETLKSERLAVETENLLPDWLDHNRRKRILAVDTSFLESLKVAKAAHVQAGNDQTAAQLESEIQALEKEIREFRSRFDTANFLQEDVPYQFINQESDLALDVEGSSKHSGAKLVQCEKSNSQSQQWFLRRVNTRFQIVNRNSGHVINVPFGKTNSGVPLIQFENGGGGGNESWRIEQSGKGFIFIGRGNQAIAIPEGTTRHGTGVIQTEVRNKKMKRGC